MQFERGRAERAVRNSLPNAKLMRVSDDDTVPAPLPFISGADFSEAFMDTFYWDLPHKARGMFGTPSLAWRDRPFLAGDASSLLAAEYRKLFRRALRIQPKKDGGAAAVSEPPPRADGGEISYKAGQPHADQIRWIMKGISYMAPVIRLIEAYAMAATYCDPPADPADKMFAQCFSDTLLSEKYRACGDVDYSYSSNTPFDGLFRTYIYPSRVGDPGDFELDWQKVAQSPGYFGFTSRYAGRDDDYTATSYDFYDGAIGAGGGNSAAPAAIMKYKPDRFSVIMPNLRFDARVIVAQAARYAELLGDGIGCSGFRCPVFSKALLMQAASGKLAIEEEFDAAAAKLLRAQFPAMPADAVKMFCLTVRVQSKFGSLDFHEVFLSAAGAAIEPHLKKKYMGEDEEGHYDFLAGAAPDLADLCIAFYNCCPMAACFGVSRSLIEDVGMRDAMADGALSLESHLKMSSLSFQELRGALKGADLSAQIAKTRHVAGSRGLAADRAGKSGGIVFGGDWRGGDWHGGDEFYDAAHGGLTGRAGLYGSPTPPAARASSVGRNDPCPCGSGKKYKKCCGKNAV
jgi:hypothetical protein